jgi:hypothetical protein
MKLPDLSKYNITTRSLLSLLRLSTDMLGKLPVRGDPPLTIAVKMLALLDSTNKVIGTSSILTDLRMKLDLKEQRSEAFVRLFFNTDLSDAFNARRIRVDDHLDLIEVTDEEGERVFFKEEHWNRSVISSDLLHTPKFNFKQAVRRVWRSYPNGIYMTVTDRPDGWGRETTFCALPASPVPYLSAAARERLDKLAATHARRQTNGKHRTYFLFGPPGSGKTTFTTQMAERFGGRLLALDAASLPHLTAPDLGFLIDMLRPGFVLIDDIDVAPIDEVRTRLRFLMPYLKRTCPETTLILTANDPAKMDRGMLRPDRIDQPIRFIEPTAAEREELLSALLDHYKITVQSEERMRIMKATQHLTYAYLNDLCSRLQEEPLDEVLESVALLHDLSEQANSAAAPPAGGPAVPTNGSDSAPVYTKSLS